MSILFYVIAAAIGLICSAVIGLFSILGGMKFATLTIVFLVVAHIVMMIFASIKARQNNIGLAVVALVSPAFLVFGAPALFEMGQSFFNTYAPDPQFSAACEHTGVQIFNAPKTPVTSVGVDWEPGRIPKTIYRVSSGGGIEGYENTFPVPEMLVDSSLADVVVTHEVSDPKEENMAPRYQKLIKYILTATDRRDGLKLATMTFAVDMAKGHACGANVKNAIDLDAFIRQAAAIGGQGGSPLSLTTSPVQEVQLEVLEKEAYSPVRVMTNDEWQNLAWDGTRRDSCEEEVPQVSKGSMQRRFLADATGKKRMAERRGVFLCDANGVWTGSYAEDFGKNTVELERYSLQGDLLYQVKFNKPERVKMFQGGIMDPTLKSREGYTEFEWWNNNQSGYDREISQRMKVRFREPLAQTPPISDEQRAAPVKP